MRCFLLTLSAALSLCFLSAASVLAQASPKAAATAPGKPVIIASGTVTGLYFPVAGAICRQMNQERDHHGIHCLVEATDGPVQNLTALRAGDVDLAIVQSDWQGAAVRGEGRLGGSGPFKDLRAVATLHAETITVLVRPEADITDLSKLKGKRVNLGPRGSALRNLSDLVIDAAGVKLPDDADMAPDEALTALCAGQLDAAFFAVGHPNGSIMKATTQCGALPVPVTGPGIDKLLSGRKDLTRAAIPAEIYPGVQDDVTTIAVAATLITRADVPDAVIAEVTRVLLEERSDLMAQHPVFNGVAMEGMADRARTAPLHPAAAKAYAAIGPAKP